MDARTRTRAAAVAALVASWGAVVLIGAGAVGAGGSAPVETAIRPLGAADAVLAQELRELQPGGSMKEAQDAARAAHAAGERAQNLLRSADDGTGRQAAGAVARHQELVDAIGSTLANPASPLRDKLSGLGDATRRSFEALGLDGMGHAGQLPADAFADFSRRRAAR